ncbi:MAG: beta-galactosidase [Clostridia bacterium]|nr:beta-galactosidase [Clostridia bacterium]
MRHITIAENLLAGTILEGEDLLCLSNEGGGISLPGMAESEERWLNFHLEVLEDHAQAFEVRLYGAEEAPRVIIRFGMMPRWLAAVAIDLNWMDGHILFPGHRVGTQKIVIHGSRIQRQEIQRAELVSMTAASPVHIRLSQVCYEDAPCAPLPLPKETWIDPFGQYTRMDWPGKIKEEETLVNFLREEAGKESAYPFDNWTSWGGDRRQKIAEGVGFFGKKKKGERWYLVDPEGYAFFSLGCDCVVARCDARIDGVEDLLGEIPSREEEPELYGERPFPWGEIDRKMVLFSYERWSLKRAFGDAWESQWQGMITGQLKRMGINTLGNWSEPALYGKMPYVTSLPEFPGTKHFIFRDFPDVLAEEYQAEATRCAQALAERREDPWMIGYFLRNEPSWAFVDDLIIADEVLRDPEDTACKAALIDWLREKYGSAEALSQAWGKKFSSFEALRQPLQKASDLSDQAKADLRAFSAILTEKYMRIPAETCRAVDPNHMILGMRWAWISDPLLVSGWDAFDVFSINCYAVDPTPAIERVRELGVDLPVMIGEFHFGALDAGLPATGLEAVPNQAERGKAYRHYCQKVAAHPNGVGCHWFQCYDQFALGRFDGENYNIGLFDITLRPHEEMRKAALQTAKEIYEINNGTQEPTAEKPQSLPMIAY